MLKIRLQRTGKRNQAAFRIVLTEKQRAAKKTPLEVLGFYNPRTKEFGIKDEERLQYWIGQHVEVSPTVNNLLIDKGLLKGEKVQSWKPKVKAKTEEEPASDDVKAAGGQETPEEKSDSSETSPEEEKPAEGQSEESKDEDKEPEQETEEKKEEIKEEEPPAPEAESKEEKPAEGNKE